MDIRIFNSIALEGLMKLLVQKEIISGKEANKILEAANNEANRN